MTFSIAHKMLRVKKKIITGQQEGSVGKGHLLWKFNNPEFDLWNTMQRTNFQ